MGEVSYPHCVTLRTSIIGHELSGQHALVEWFLLQEGPVRGFSRAIFSGLPTVELARVVRDFVLTNSTLSGVYHVASEPISKFDLLVQIAAVYGKKIEIERECDFVLDRSLNSLRFTQATGYVPPSWPALIARMHDFFTSELYV
jgi:dTDP-4-dehydrorhamnose reductase